MVTGTGARCRQLVSARACPTTDWTALSPIASRLWPWAQLPQAVLEALGKSQIDRHHREIALPSANALNRIDLPGVSQ